MPSARSTAAPWSLTKEDMREARYCKNPDCGSKARIRTLDSDGEIRYLCYVCAAGRLGVRVDTLEDANGESKKGEIA